MTDHVQDSQYDSVLELLSEHGFDGVKEAMETLFNEAMKIERSVHPGAGLHERSDARASYANGYNNKQVKTRVGELSLKVPQTRDADFYPASLEKGIRSERALKLALAEMYVQGVSTRKVAKLTEQMCGLELSTMQVSRAAKALDEQLSAWRTVLLATRPTCFLMRSIKRYAMLAE